MSDHRVSFRRSSKGKSKSVASIMVVSSIETVSTQSNSSPSGNESKTLQVRSRINCSISANLGGATAGVTALRWSSCSGGSWAINVVMPNAPSGNSASIGKPSTIPCAELKFFQSASTFLMSLYFVRDQYRPARSVWLKWTGSSALSRSKYSV